MNYRSDYPNEPIGGGNPYYRCKACKISDPQINGRLEGHSSTCSWRIAQMNKVAVEGKLQQIHDIAEQLKVLCLYDATLEDLVDKILELAQE